MSLDADLIYNDIRHDISNRVVFNYFSELHPNREDSFIIDCEVTLDQLLDLHKMLCEVLYKEQMDLDLENPTVWEEVISPVRRAIKALQNDPNLEVWYNGGY